MDQALILGAAAAVGLYALVNSPTTLHGAAARNNVTVLKELLQKGHSPEERNTDGQTPLHIAAQRGHVPIIKKLLEYRSSLVFRRNDNHQTPLMVAVTSETTDAVRILVQYDKSQIEEAISKSNNVRVIRVLLDALPDKGIGMLCKAARNGNVKKLLKLLKNDVSPNAKDHSGLTPLHHAATTGQMESISKLIFYRASINVKDSAGDTPLHKAVKSNRVKAARALVHAGANREAMNNRMETPYKLAHSQTMYEVVKPSVCSIM